MTKQAIKNWLNTNHIPFDKLKPLAGDASFRRYYRLHFGKHTDILMDATQQGPMDDFCTLQHQLMAHHILVPTIKHTNHNKTLLVLEDLGSTHLFNQTDQPQNYRDAIDLLIKIQSIPLPTFRPYLPTYNKELIKSEYFLFTHWFIEKLLKKSVTWPINMLTIFNEYYQQLPQTFVHRDYHSKNILIHNAKLFIIDFQDAVIGPFSYDLVSILEDCYHQLPLKQKNTLYQHYYQQAQNACIIPLNYTFEQFRKNCALTAFQRHLKAIGIFARLFLRDKKPNYLKHIPLTLNYAIDEAAVLSESIQNQLIKIKQHFNKHR